MGELTVEDKSIVVPGETLAKGMDFLPTKGTYREGEEIIASRLGLVSVDGKVIKLIPLSGRYLPKREDVIIGQVIDITMNGWIIDFAAAYTAMLSMRDATSAFIRKGADLTRYYNFGDYIVAEIVNVTSQKLVDLSMKGPGLRKLTEGRVVKVPSTKVPRIVGKKGSMVSLIKNYTGCRVIVGQNGLVWVQGDPENELVAVEAINMIEKEAHMSGLTERMTAFLEKKSKGLKMPERREEPDMYHGPREDFRESRGNENDLQ